MKRFIHDAFEIGITLKFLNALLEVIGAILVLAINPNTLGTWIIHFTTNSLQSDSGDWIYNQAVNFAQNFSVQSQTFAVLYLGSHGIIKIFLVICLWRRKLWAYPLAITVFVSFGIYQMYRYYLTGSQLMVWLTVLDAVVIWLTYQEYKNLKNRLNVV